MVFTGLHAIEEYIKLRNRRGTLYYCKNNARIDRIIRMAEENGYNVNKITAGELQKLSKGESGRGIIFIGDDSSTSFRDLDSFLQSTTDKNTLIIILDGVTDPHNLGAVVRSAALFNTDLVIIPSRRSVKETDVVSKTSAGASTYVPVLVETNLVRTIEKLKKRGFWVYGAKIDGIPLPSVKFSGKTALILGSEGKGMRNLVEKQCDFLVSIPTSGKIDSLNISVAAGIFLYEIYQQSQDK